MSTDDNKQVVRDLIEDLNKDRLDGLDELVARDYQQDNPSAPAGREGLKGLFAKLRSGFPDLSVTIEELVAEGDTVVAVTRMRGTQQGEVQGIAATGRPVNLTSIDIYRVSDGRIVEHFGRFDELGMLEQLGVAHDLSWPGPR